MSILNKNEIQSMKETKNIKGLLKILESLNTEIPSKHLIKRRNLGKWTILQILDSLDSSSAAYHLIDELSNEDISSYVFNVLRNNDVYTEYVQKQLTDVTLDPVIRANCAEILGYYKNPKMLDSLLIGLKDNHYLVRAMSAISLGKIGNIKAIDSLVEALEDSNLQVKGNVAEALGSFKDRRIISPLMNIVTSESKYVKDKARASLRKLNLLVDQFLDDFKTSGREEKAKIIEILGWIGDGKALKILIPGVDDFIYDDDGDIIDYSISDESIKAIERLSFGLNDLEYLFEMVKDKGGFLRELAYKCEHQIKIDTGVFRQLVITLDDDNNDISEFSRSVLSSRLFGDINSKDYKRRRDFLQYLCKDTNPRVKEYAKKQFDALEEYWHRED